MSLELCRSSLAWKRSAPKTQPRKKKVEPAPEPVLPPVPQPNTASFDAGPYRNSSVSNVQQVHHSPLSNEPTAVVTDENPQITALGPQLSARNAPSLISDESIPFIVPSKEIVASKEEVPAPPVAQKPDGLLIPLEMKGIKLLPVADQRLALAQRTCPVTDDLLGSDGKPFKVAVRGRTVFVCCDDCVEDLQRNPAALLGKK